VTSRCIYFMHIITQDPKKIEAEMVTSASTPGSKLMLVSLDQNVPVNRTSNRSKIEGQETHAAAAVLGLSYIRTSFDAA
jgi:hypothetical protein